MLTNTVIKVAFGDLPAEQISGIIFQCGVLYHTEFDFLWLFIHLRPRKSGFKYPALLINIFILYRTHDLDLLCWARYVSICSIYFFAKKVAIDFCQFFSQLLRILFSLNLWNKKWGSSCSFTRKRAFTSLSSLVWGKSITFCTRARSFARANDAKIVRSRNAQCKTRESP